MAAGGPGARRTLRVATADRSRPFAMDGRRPVSTPFDHRSAACRGLSGHDAMDAWREQRTPMADARYWTHDNLALLETMPDAIVAVDRHGVIVYANHLIEEMFGYPPHALVGQPVEVLHPEEGRDAHRQHRRDYAAAPAARRWEGGKPTCAGGTGAAASSRSTSVSAPSRPRTALS